MRRGRGKRWCLRGQRAEPQQPSGWLNQAILIALSIVIFVQGGFFSRSLTSPDPYPASACEFMKQHHLRGNILNTFQWGDYLIWHTAPESKVFIDGRYDTVFPLESHLQVRFVQLSISRAAPRF